MKAKKSLLMFLICVLLLSTSAMPAFANCQAINDKITDTQQAINLIEQEFLGINEDGTSYIKADAAKYIDPEVLHDITKGMNAINEKILSGVLIRDKTTNVITPAKNTEISPQVILEGYFVYLWYGFDFVIDAYNSGLAAIELRRVRDNLLAGLAVAAFWRNGTMVLATGIEVVVYNTWIARCEQGQYTGKGACLCYLGDPYGWCALMNIYVME